MRPTAELRNDHEVLRAKLELLEGLLPLVGTTQFPVRDLVHSIARRLRCHTEKEEVLLEALNAAQQVGVWPITAHLGDEHRDQEQSLAMLQQLLMRGPRCPVDAVMAYGGHFVDELREHMAHEEARIFPAAERLVSEAQRERIVHRMRQIAQRYYPEGEPHLPGPRPASCPITQEMTVNHVLRAHPHARPTLESFGVECGEDGCCCLDELYWKRGVELDDLLRALNHATCHGGEGAHGGQVSGGMVTSGSEA